MNKPITPKITGGQSNLNTLSEAQEALARLDRVWGGTIDRSMDKTSFKIVSRDDCKTDYEHIVRNGY